MSSAIWTPDALRSEAHPRSGGCWRLVEAQHRVSTMKLTDTLDEQTLLEAEIERSKPPVPPECAHLDYLLSTPFRYGRYPGPSRFRREGYTPGVFYASDNPETAVAETAFYRLLFLAESPDTPPPRNALEFTAFEAAYSVPFAIDLTARPFDRDADLWRHPTDYTACLALADAARGASVEMIRYASVRDPRGGANVALLTCAAFAEHRPRRLGTWRLSVARSGVMALSDWSADGMEFPAELFSDDPRLRTT